jgi:hypothetical protein
MSYQFGAAQDVFAQAATIVLVTPVVPSEAPTAKVLQGLFEPGASARVAGSIGEGRTVDAIATALGLSRETIRSQLKALLSKPDASRFCSRQRRILPSSMLIRQQGAVLFAWNNRAIFEFNNQPNETALLKGGEVLEMLSVSVFMNSAGRFYTPAPLSCRCRL